jgi:pimeloyl-ACP methyl ester carboxylesterase
MDKLPTKDQEWIASSPYPHYIKHQEEPFLSGADYRAIPQKYLKIGEGGGLAKLVIHPYWLMQHEFSYWARRINQKAGWEKVKIFDDWQVLAPENSYGVGNAHVSSECVETIGEINVIILKFDWRLGLPEVTKHYAEPLLSFIRKNWPTAEIHWVGHSLGGLIGRYTASCFPHSLKSLITIGAPHYGLYEITLQRKGERATYGGQWDIEISQEYGLWIMEKILFGTKIVRLGADYLKSAALFTEKYTPLAKWLDPSEGLLSDGFGHLPKLEEAVQHSIAIYGLGYGGYDLHGVYHYEIKDWRGVGPGLEPNEKSPSDYANCGDGRVDPVSARGPFKHTLCLGQDQPHGNLMWSALVLTTLIDRHFFAGEMPPSELWRSLRRLGVSWDKKAERLAWISKAREAWNNQY